MECLNCSIPTKWYQSPDFFVGVLLRLDRNEGVCMSVVWILIIGVAAFLILKRRPPLEIPEESQTAVKASGKCGPDAEWRLHEDGQLYTFLKNG